MKRERTLLAQPSASLGSFSFRGNALLSAITLLGLGLRVARIDFQPLWFDEGYSIFFATRALPELFDRTALDIHPPLYYVLLQFWLNLSGSSAIAARLWSVCIGVAAIPVLYALARRLWRDSRVATISALLLALSPLHIYYSQEVRMYGLLLLMGLASTYFFARLLEQPSRLIGALYASVTAAALYTQYYAAFLIAFQILYIFMKRSDFHRRMICLWLAIGLLYLPWLVYAGLKLYVYVTSKVAIESYAALDPLTFLFQHLTAFSLGHLAELQWLALFAIPYSALVWLGLVRSKDSTMPNSPRSHVFASPRLFLTLYLLIPLALGYLVNLRYTFHPPRYERLLLFAAPAFYLIAARGIETLWARRARFGALALSAIALASGIALSDFYAAPRYAKDDYRPLIAQLQALAQSNDNFLAIYPWQIGYLETYYRGAPLRVIETPSAAWIGSAPKLQGDVNALLQKNSRAWLPALQTQGRILEDALDAYLRPRAYSITDVWFGNTRLLLFAQADDPPPATTPLAFENDLTVPRWGIAPGEHVAGQDTIRVWFDWSEDSASNLKLSLRLSDRDSNIWAQDDREVTNGIQRIGLAVPNGTPRGEYTLSLALYRARDGAPVRSAASRDSVLLARVRIAAPAQANLAALSHRVDAPFANGMRLLAAEIPDALQPGTLSPIVLYWETTRALAAEYTPVIQLRDGAGKIVATTRANIAYGVYPPSEWHVGEIVRDPQTLLVFGDVAAGNYELAVALENRTGARERTMNGRESLTLRNITVKHRAHYFGAPGATNRVDYRFGNTARLVGYDVRVDSARQTARVALYWQALAAPRISYHGFAHLYDAADKLVTQHDQIPGAGAYPTTSWVRNEYLVDYYDLALPSAARGIYKIRVGMYDSATGARVTVFDASDRSVGDIVELSTRVSIE